MSSDNYFDGDDLDSAFFDEVDAIETSQLASTRPTHPTSQPGAEPAPKPLQRVGTDEYDMSFNFNDSELAQLDDYIEEQYKEKAIPVAGPSKLTRQTTLFGDTVHTQPTPAKPPPARSQQQRTRSNQRLPFGKKAPKVKQWDHTAFAKSGWKKPKAKGKGKAVTSDAEDEDAEEIEFEQFPAPFVSGEPFWVRKLMSARMPVSPCFEHDRNFRPPPPMKVKPDLLAAKTWIYPTNQSRRDYQFNIVKNSLFENTLVALPTGLGKTFIAGVVMLNYYNWFPEGKVIFVAPTKPLVAQQIDACHRTCGIPGRDAAELTGAVLKSKRIREWAEKRVFYMTPHTLINDLVSGICDPSGIVLLVVDEAHKSTGDYAYTQVVRFLMAKNPHFRLLALTATPGGKPEAVQAIVDSLHISHIEIRDERSLDLKPYIFKKEIVTHVIEMNEHILKIRDPLARLMETRSKRLRDSGILYFQNVISLHHYSCQYAQQTIGRRPDAKQLNWAYPALKTLGVLARAMGHLLEFSVSMCYSVLKELAAEPKSGDRSKSPGIREDINFKKVMQELERQHAMGFQPHPKMEKLQALAINHFQSAMEDDHGTQTTRMMVFVMYRDCVEEVVKLLNQQQPLIRATKFIGQSADKQGTKGIGQARQLKVIEQFKNGVFNVMVATSIGEEGLDIGEIDRIVCYDAQKSPIRMLQRVGRTGRKRRGFVDVLLAQEREERNWDQSKESYEDVQQAIVRGDQLELYADVERLIPDHIKPQCLQIQMEIEAYVRPNDKNKENTGLPSEKGAKRKRNDDVKRNVPRGAVSGFVSVKDLIVKGTAKSRKKAKLKPLDPSAVEDDDTDLEIAAGLTGSIPPKSVKAKAKMQPALRRRTAKSSGSHPSPSQCEIEDDSDDIAIQSGLQLSPRTRPSEALHGNRSQLSQSTSDQSDEDESVQLLSSPPHNGNTDSDSSPESPTGETGDPPRSSSRSGGTLKPEGSRSRQDDDDIAMAWLMDDANSDSEPELLASHTVPGKSSDTVLGKTTDIAQASGFTSARYIEIDDSLEEVPVGNAAPPAKGGKQKTEMLPPPLPSRLQSSPIVSSPACPESTFPVRASRVQRKRIALPSQDSSPFEIPTSSHRRLKRRQESSSPPVERIKRKRVPLPRDVHNPWYDMEAVHSGDELSEGDSDVSIVETEADRQFLQELPATQASPSYNQAAAYRLGLLTQAPAGVAGPVFATKPKRVGQFAGGRSDGPRRLFLSSSPERGSNEPDEYLMDTFVVPDDESILYDTQLSSDL